MYIINSFNDAKEYGSIINIKNIDFDKLLDLISNFKSNKLNLNRFKYQNELQMLENILNQSKILSKKYDIVITNPPYMGNSGMNPKLKDYLKNNFPNSKSDLFAVFIEKCHEFCKPDGYVAMITQQSFMFLSTFEKLRVELINNHTIINMAHLGAHAFEEIGGEVVQATSFINKNVFIPDFNSTFHRLTEFNSESGKEREFHNDENKHITSQNNFDKIPGTPIAYWASQQTYNHFNNDSKIKDLVKFSGSLHKTANNDKYLRYFWEIDIIVFLEKFIPYDRQSYIHG